ncbi:MAG: hypothetical protein GPJ52_00150 [Candidatus Heimdallarchaeota archaeon]|nr:hypothetical protein [Candidatus Heimdallarchaeota archaeon]
MRIDAVKKIDKKLREIILEKCILPSKNEHILLSFCILNQVDISPLNKYPFIYAFEYEIKMDNKIVGKGDLLLANMNFDLLVVELKHLTKARGYENRVKRTNARNKVYEQTIRYRDLIQAIYPNSNVENFALTNDLLDNNKELADKFKIFKEQIIEKCKRKDQLFPEKIADKV